MSMDELQRDAAIYMGALAQILSGLPDRQGEFREKVELILSGSEPDAMVLLQFAGRVRATGRPVIWVHVPADNPDVPLIGLVALDRGTTPVFENCAMWMPAAGGAARLIPDNFKMGAYRFNRELRLVHEKKPFAGHAAEKGLIRAYRRLREIEAELRASGHVIELPSRGSFKKAA